MGNIFSNKQAATENLIEDDFLGGNNVVDTDIYPAKIKYAYIGKAANSDARNLTLCVVLDGKHEMTRSIWMTNRKGEVTYVDKRTGKLNNLPGYNLVNSLAMLLLSQTIDELEVEEKTLNLYDFDSKKEIPQAVECFVDLHGLDLHVAVQRQTVDKTEKNDQTGDYEPTGETRDVNEFIKFFPANALVTISEVAHYIKSLGGSFNEVLKEGDISKAVAKMEDDGDYATKWLAKNRGQTYNRSVGKKENKSFGNKSSGDGGSSKKTKSNLFDD